MPGFLVALDIWSLLFVLPLIPPPVPNGTFGRVTLLPMGEGDVLFLFTASIRPIPQAPPAYSHIPTHCRTSRGLSRVFDHPQFEPM